LVAKSACVQVQRSLSLASVAKLLYPVATATRMVVLVATWTFEAETAVHLVAL
jgi:hypothetical protein